MCLSILTGYNVLQGGVTFSSVPGSVKGRVIKMVNVVGHPRTTSPTGISFFPQQVPVTVVGPSISQPMSVHQSNVQPILQMLEQESNTHILNNKAQEIQSIKNLSISVAQVCGFTNSNTTSGI